MLRPKVGGPTSPNESFVTRFLCGGVSRFIEWPHGKRSTITPIQQYSWIHSTFSDCGELLVPNRHSLMAVKMGATLWACGKKKCDKLMGSGRGICL